MTPVRFSLRTRAANFKNPQKNFMSTKLACKNIIILN
jgi:hypothetical protein